MQTFVHTLLRSRTLYTLGALLLTSMFWWSGIAKLFEFGAAQSEMAHFGMQPAALFAAATIAVQLGGSALIVFAAAGPGWAPVRWRCSRSRRFRSRMRSGRSAAPRRSSRRPSHRSTPA